MTQVTYNGYRLKNYHEAGGDETVRFEAILTKDGKDIAVVSNDGYGGSHRYDTFAGMTGALKEFEEFAKQWRADSQYAGFEDGDRLVDHLAEMILLSRKRGVLFLFDDEDFVNDGQCRVLSIPAGATRERLIAALKAEYPERNVRVFDKKSLDFIAV